ncbi:MAG: response regulator [Sphingobacteriaceae bacterium]
MIEKERPDIIILDLSIPILPSQRILSRLKKNTVTADIPILLMSENPDVRKISLNAGAHIYLEKPLNLYKLYKMINERLGLAG